MQCKIYWPHMDKDVYTTMNNFRKSAWNRASKTRKRHLNLFPVSSLLDIIVMDGLGLLRKMASGKQVVLIMSDRYSEFTREVHTSNSGALHIASTIYDHQIVSFGISAYFLTGKGPPFVSNHLKPCAIFLGWSISYILPTTPRLSGR